MAFLRSIILLQRSSGSLPPSNRIWRKPLNNNNPTGECVALSSISRFIKFYVVSRDCRVCSDSKNKSVLYKEGYHDVGAMSFYGIYHTHSLYCSGYYFCLSMPARKQKK